MIRRRRRRRLPANNEQNFGSYNPICNFGFLLLLVAQLYQSKITCLVAESWPAFGSSSRKIFNFWPRIWQQQQQHHWDEEDSQHLNQHFNLIRARSLIEASSRFQVGGNISLAIARICYHSDGVNLVRLVSQSISRCNSEQPRVCHLLPTVSLFSFFAGQVVSFPLEQLANNNSLASNARWMTGKLDDTIRWPPNFPPIESIQIFANTTRLSYRVSTVESASQ